MRSAFPLEERRQCGFVRLAETEGMFEVGRVGGSGFRRFRRFLSRYREHAGRIDLCGAFCGDA